ncbi:hypothetical protein ACIBO1_06700 [Micromonospora sp. NPDC049903]|uniref:hypothetical protein n=1 Tax=Micromonospora sp. NPDC049903 TaxID=3364276 RepID=UPI00379934B6
MPVRTQPPDALAWQVFRGSDVVRRGLLTAHQLRNSAWVRLRHDVYADARLDRDHTLACRAAALQLPAGAAVAGPSAAYLHGIGHAADFDQAVHVLVPTRAGLRSQRGLRVHTESPQSLAGLTIKGTPPHTDTARAAWESAVWLEPSRSVGIVDALLGRGLTTPAALAEVAAANDDRPGGRRARWVFDLADPAAQSPDESRLRVGLVLAGLPRPVAHHPVSLPGGVVLRPGLAWPQQRVAVEFDGQRLYPLAGAGWLIRHVTGRRLHQDLPGVAREIRAALLDGGRPR